MGNIPENFEPLITPSVRAVACPLSGGSDDYDPLIEMIGDARYVFAG